jgi:hypothetical protein
MKNEVLYLLLNNYADHEAVFLASAIACDERSIKENPKELVPLERDNSSHLQYTFYVLRILNNPLV